MLMLLTYETKARFRLLRPSWTAIIFVPRSAYVRSKNSFINTFNFIYLHVFFFY